MHIKRIVIEGFKCYKDKLQPAEFSPLHNCIVGANGSGKSNFFAAIQFVLDTNSTTLRAEERKALLHEGAGAHVLSAYVEVYIDNSDRRMPIDSDEVVIRRSIGLKKDEYFIDRKHTTKTEVASLLETSGLSKANPYNIVPQGKVNALTTMRDENRLEIIKDIAGTKTYDLRRAESMVLMEETADKQTRVKENLQYIQSKLETLEKEKEELVAAQTLEKRRAVLEYTYYDKELRKARTELERMDAQRSETSKEAAESSKLEEEAARNAKEAERKLKGTREDLQRVAQEWQTIAAEQKELLEQVARREMSVKQAASDAGRREEQQSAAAAELAEIDGQVAEVEAQLEEGSVSTTEKREEADRCSHELEKAEAAIRALHAKEGRTAQFASKAARDKHLNKEAADLKVSLQKKEQQAATLRSDLDAAIAKLGENEKRAVEGRKRLAERRAEAEAARAQSTELRAQRDKAADERKTLWRTEQELITSHKAAADELDKAQRTLQHSMSRSQWEAIAAVRRIVEQKNVKGFYGMLIELFTVDEKFNTAIEVTAGTQLFQVVVDTDETAATLLKELQKANAGRVTFMPLNRLRPREQEYPVSEDCISMISRLSFKPMFKPAMAEVFRKGLIVRTLEVGLRFARSHELDCVTIGGDQVNRKGAMTGGYLEPRRSRISARADIVRLTADVAKLEREQRGAEAALVAVDQRVTTLLGDLQKQETVAQKAIAAAELEAIDLPVGAAAVGGGTSRAANAHKAADAQKERAHAALLAAVQSDRERLATIEAEVGSDFTSKLSDAEKKELTALHGKVGQLQKARDAAVSEAAKAESVASTLRDQLNEHLRKRQEELQETIARLGEEEAGGADGDGEAQLEEARTKLATTDAALKDAADEREEKRKLEISLAATAEELKAQVAAERARQAEEAKSLDRLLSRRGLLQQKVEEFTGSIRKLGAIPKEGLDGVHASSSAKQLLSEIEKCHKEIAKLGHVNKKALDQFTAFSEQRDHLHEKQAEMEEARESIEELMTNLDHKKDEALERTFKSVSHEFTRCFQELVPGGSGKLIMALRMDMPTGVDVATRVANYTGVSIKVQFPSGGVATSMSQLSGGQKTMVALCLIFAIQRCDPAPFYIFDEIDAALDATHRAALSAMIERQSSEVDDDGNEKPNGSTQFVTTTFRPELIKCADQCYGVTHANKVSTIGSIKPEEALRIITEDQNRQRQHIGVSH